MLAAGIALYLLGDVIFRRCIHIPSSRLRLGMVVLSLLTGFIGVWAGGLLQVSALLGIFMIILIVEWKAAKRAR
ncbi:MAG: hypothetical protein SH847_23160 [Roseiflexaceae bacterium]|nr:hypothetical protein [Roseiflexaceae bacterium]